MKVGELAEILSRYDDEDELIAFKLGKFSAANYVVVNVWDTENNFVGLTIENATKEEDE